MTESKYEKYVVREPTRIGGRDELDWTTVRNAMTTPPFSFLLGDKPIKEAHTLAEISWVWKDTAIGATLTSGPHKHDYDEIFWFCGTNREDLKDFGAEVEMWMGEGDQAEKITINTSSVVFVPKGTVHLPIIFMNVKKPIMLILIGLNMTELKPIYYPLRNISYIPKENSKS